MKRKVTHIRLEKRPGGIVIIPLSQSARGTKFMVGKHLLPLEKGQHKPKLADLEALINEIR